MTGKSKPKSRNKIVETSLGKAPKDVEEGPDLSHLRAPITTSVSTLKHIFALFQTATPEVQNYITFECDLLYECRFCRTLFRSLANFILHKRKFCRNKWQYGGQSNQGGFVVNDDVKTSDEDSRCTTPMDFDSNRNVPESHTKKRNIMPVIDKLLKRQKGQILAKDVLNEDLSKNDNSDDDVMFVSEESNIVLQKIGGSGAAVFQTKIDDCEKKDELMKSEVLEIHDILHNNQATLDASGKVAPKSSNPLVCTECNFTFSTEKTLTHHIKYKHNKTCIVFPCPDCKETFSNAWSVYRHLYKVHRRTLAQVRRMRYLVHSSGIRKDQEPEKKKRKLDVVQDENEENQWMNNFEGDKDIQMCGGCGKRFERKAALHSHSQMCIKRIAICNSIKNVKVQKDKKDKEQAVSNETKVKGAAKRKQMVLIKPRKELVRIKAVTELELDKAVTEEEKAVDTAVTEKEKPELELDEATAEKEKLEPELDKPVAEEEKPEPVLDRAVTEDEELEPELEEVGKPEDVVNNEEDPLGSVLTPSSDMTITKDPEPPSPSPPRPEIEIFTISDDSSDSATPDKQKPEIPDEYKEYITDEEDHLFLSKMMQFINKQQLRCTNCDAPFMSLYMLLRHMSLHFSWYRYQCSKCSFVSFHKYDCTTHAYNQHSVTSNLIDSTVMPIPQWKVLSASHDFKNLEEERVAVMPLLEPEKVPENGMAETETIILEDDDMPDITENGFTDPLLLSDDDRDKKGEKRKADAAPSFVSSRPIRNRTRSVKTVQNDFIYDLGPGFKFDKKKAKKSFSK